LQNQQKFLAQTSKSKNGIAKNHLSGNLNNTSSGMMSKQATAYKGFAQGRIGSQNSRKENSEELKQRQEQNCYTDEELHNINKEFKKINPGSIQRTGSSRQQRRVKASTTKGNDAPNEEVMRINQNAMNSYVNTAEQTKSLYTNISLREISQSPDQRTTGLNSGKVINISNGKNGQSQQKKMI
jgi:hypothetical protein